VKIRSLGDPNQQILLLHSELRRRDIWTTLKKRRRHRDRNFWMFLPPCFLGAVEF
jgi:hypothetical protein